MIQLMVGVGEGCGFFVVFKKRQTPSRMGSYYQKEMQCFKQHKCRIREAYDELGCSVWSACLFFCIQMYLECSGGWGFSLMSL